jgi:signal peptidase
MGASMPARRVGRALTDVLLWIGAGLGCICMVLVVLAVTAGVTLMMFRTGSMSPAIPAGSVAVVQQIAASEIHVGDVVTVDRAGGLPITHRVTSVQPGSSSAIRVITMRGDANAQDDLSPYPIESARIVRFSIPGIAPAIAAMGSPLVLGGITVAAASLALWAFWPRRSPRPEETT